MNRCAKVYCGGVLAGSLDEVLGGVEFTYDPYYVANPKTRAISLTLPKQLVPHFHLALLPFFYGLLPKGALRKELCRRLKLKLDDSFGLLLATAGKETIGNVTVVEDREGA